MPWAGVPSVGKDKRSASACARRGRRHCASRPQTATRHRLELACGPASKQNSSCCFFVEIFFRLEGGRGRSPGKTGLLCSSTRDLYKTDAQLGSEDYGGTQLMAGQAKGWFNDMIGAARNGMAGAVQMNKHDVWKSALDSFTLEEVLRGSGARQLVRLSTTH